MMKNYVKLFEEFISEKKPAGAPKWHDSDAPDAEGRFKELGIKDLAAWLIKTRKKDLKKISGSITQQIVFNRKKDPEYAKKMEKVRKEVYRQLGREDLLEVADTDGFVTCENCGWSWDVAQGGKDPYTCHECGQENKMEETFIGDLETKNLRSLAIRKQKEEGDEIYVDGDENGEVVDPDGDDIDF
jgi:hypothetical protein